MEKISQAFEKVNTKQALDKMKMFVGMDVDDDDEESAAASSSGLQHQDSFIDDFNSNCTLSTKQRFYGFAICLAAGLTCTLLGLPNKSVVLAVKALLLGMIIHAYNYRPHLHPYVILALYCCHMYLGLEIFFLLITTPVRTLRFELEPQSNEPYLSTSLQDFWSRRWNLMVTNMLHPMVYDPTRRVRARVVGERWARLSALMTTFAVSGLMHDATYYYLTCVQPTWEVTWFFVLHGACMAVEVEVKKAVANRWRLHPVVSGLLTFVFLAVTGNWLFFPQLLRNGVDTKARGEYAIMVGFVNANLPHLHYKA
ncbi:hypothetical protein ACLB2K_007456 [Fragaria x ananassa]